MWAAVSGALDWAMSQPIRKLGAWLALATVGIVLAGGAAPPASSALAVPPDLQTAPPVRELQLAAAPDGSLVLATLTDAGEASSGRGEFMARNLRAWRYAGGSWQPLGGVLNYNVPRAAADLDLALDERGTPILVWNENYGDNDVVVLRAYLGGAWTNWQPRYLGDDLPYAARTRSVAAYGGEAVLAWGEYLRKPYGSRLSIRHWNGQTWTRSLPFNDIRAFSRSPALALSGAGMPTVAWLQGEVLGSNILVSRWTGDRWQALGASLNRTPNSYLASPRLVLDVQERPTVAWLEDVGGQDALFASRWNGQAWQALGGRISPRFAEAPALALDAQNRPVVAWAEERGGIGQIKLARWTGQRWQTYGPLNRDARRDARSPALALAADGVVLAWREDVGGVYRVQMEQMQ